MIFDTLKNIYPKNRFHIYLEELFDVIQKLQALAKKENELAKEKVNKGEYRGAKAEIDAQMRKEFAKKLPEMLEEAYQTMENGKQETMTLTVKKGENGLYTVDIGKFLIKLRILSQFRRI